MAYSRSAVSVTAPRPHRFTLGSSWLVSVATKRQSKHDVLVSVSTKDDVFGQISLPLVRFFTAGAGVRRWGAGDVRWSHRSESSLNDHIDGNVRWAQ